MFLLIVLEEYEKYEFVLSQPRHIYTTITHAYFPTIESRITNRHFKPEYKLTQFISGHGKFAEYLHRYKCTRSPMCECNAETDSALHYQLFINCLSEIKLMFYY